MSLLEVCNLRTNFHTESGLVRAVNDVSFSLDSDETIGIVGESGCGKSATALSIMRLIQPPAGKIMSGQVKVEGKNLFELSVREMRQIRGSVISMIFQDPMTSLNPVFTVGNQIVEALMIHRRMKRREARARAIELLSTTGIPRAEKRIDDYPFEFSGGMRQRAMIAMALACKPRILIADEPTTALDVTIQAQILRLISDLKRKNRTAVILITHDLGIVAEMADRVLVMYAGKIIESGSVRDIYYSPHHPYTKGLLQSIPRLTSSKSSKLYQIEGNPPQLVNLPKGCSFCPRCKYCLPACQKESPELRKVGPQHHSACIRDDGTNG
jgi:oligopeptide/dipeptide ABC transporter ATP-binding protein